MAASANDLLQQVGSPGSATTLSAPGYTVGNTSITVPSTSNWPTGTGCSFAIDMVTVAGGVTTQVPNSYNEFIGLVSSSTSITGLSKTFGVAQNYPAGATTRVYIPVSSTRENRLVQWGTAHADQAGALLPGIVGAANLTTNAITLGYAQITSNFTTSSTTVVQATGLTTTVTIPAGGRKVRVSFLVGFCSNSSIGFNTVSIWDGTVGSGTKIAETTAYIPNGGGGYPMPVSAIITPSAGSKTYNIGFLVSAGSGFIVAAATNPAYILVEVI